jgi:hypothetical protein
MKKFILSITACFMLMLIAFIPPTKTLVGSWVIHYGNDQKINLNFNNKGIIKVAIPAEQFTVEGKFKFKDGILYISDSTCGSAYWGKYKETFLSDDSLYSVMLEDSCIPRKSAMDKATLIRVKM